MNPIYQICGLFDSRQRTTESYASGKASNALGANNKTLTSTLVDVTQQKEATADAIRSPVHVALASSF